VITVDKLINSFLLSLKEEKNYSKNTIDSYEKDFKIFKTYLEEQKINDIKKIDSSF